MGEGMVHVVGAGVAGLAAATHLAERGRRVIVWDGAVQAGGRCRSYHDPQLDLVIDNGNHLVLSGNRAVYAYLSRIGAEDGLTGPDEAEFAFVDLRDDARWTVRPNPGPLAWWALDPKRRPPGVRASEFLRLLPLMGHPDAKLTVGEAIRTGGPLWDKLIHPFLVAALNTAPETGSARLAASVIRETLAQGGRAYRPRVAQPTLSAALIDPALEFIVTRGGEVRLGRRVRELECELGRVRALAVGEERVALGPDDRVILAVSATAATTLLPFLTAPARFRAIVNGHFRHPGPAEAPLLTGVLGGTVEWIFCFEDRISVTVSDADRLVDTDRDALAATLWGEVAQALRLEPALPPWRIVKERRATFAATPEEDARRPDADRLERVGLDGVILAGDWTNTGLPATLEGACRSGERAAELAMRPLIG